jgi:LDH2 family malate/lactate/ureidoglycolate dehydrogenase
MTVLDPISLTAAALVATAVQAFATEAGQSAWSGLSRLVKLIRTKLVGDDAGNRALEEVQANPGDEIRTRELASAIDRHVGADASFREQLAQLLREAQADPIVGQFVTTVSGNAQVGKIVNIRDVTGNVSF